MDKLKPIIDQKFWIFLGLALIVPFVGWYLASNSYATGVDQRESDIKSSFDSVNLSGEIVNGSWVTAADEIVKEQEALLQKSQRQLWLVQSEGMDWPPTVTPFLEDVPYEGQIPARAREFYSKTYHPQLAKMEQRLRPFNYLTGEGVLLFEGYQTGASYPHVPESQWINQPPTSQEMWNAQIDFWLVRAVFESIISINQGQTKLTEAPVRQVLELSLRGGTRDYSAGSGSSVESGGGNTSDSDMFGGMDTYAPEGGGGSGTSGGASIKTQVQFDLSEELGPAASGSGAQAGGNMEDIFDGSSTPTDSTSETTSNAASRYVDDDESSPFRTRAFVLGVVMDQKVLPEFLAELSRSDWPIQIIRVQTETINPEQLSLANTRLTRPGMGGIRPGMGGINPGGSSFGGSSPFDSIDDGGGSSYGVGGSESPFSSGRPTGRVPRTSIPGVAAGGGRTNAAGLVQQAMSDPYLAQVWIGGLITLFRPVEETESATAENEVPQNGNMETQLNGLTDPDSAETLPEPAAGDESTTSDPADDSTEPATEGDPSETGNGDTQPLETQPDSASTSTSN